jgi:Ca2+-binding EF-hand superfamily protein
MGASTSQLTPEEVQELQEASSFNAKEIKKLYARFQRLDRGNAGVLTTADFQLLPELSMNPLCHRIIAVIDKEKRDQVCSIKSTTHCS